MAVVFGDDIDGRFSFLEYQGLLFVLAIIMCLSLGVVELAMKRFALLPMLFPGVFSIREKRFYFYDIEVRDVYVGKALRWEAMMLTRVTLCVVLSYLWEFCVFQTTTQVGRQFPEDQCKAEMDCFASEFHFLTFFNRDHQPVDCTALSTMRESGQSVNVAEFFDNKVVVSCIAFVPPSATLWLMHLAIAHSQVQLTQKAFGVLTWSCGQSKIFHRVIAASGIIALGLFIGLFFGGVMTQFLSSWLAFVISLSVPVFCQIVWKSGRILQQLWLEESRRAQASIEENLASALKDLTKRTGTTVEEDEVQESRYRRRKRHSKTLRFGFSKAKETIMKLPTMLKRKTGSDSEGSPGGAQKLDQMPPLENALQEMQAADRISGEA
eukprot:TRINITY_DN95529_c0_g1_i1.p1 TRINITY_DN95529_c0_g1~~TRINITY_DN95529_c0_g1_i1.p1  ORF type:complete len:399 (+),score=78.76 TRINITY_DN95529_c0_g1_i1:60-1199(+)